MNRDLSFIVRLTRAVIQISYMDQQTIVILTAGRYRDTSRARELVYSKFCRSKPMLIRSEKCESTIRLAEINSDSDIAFLPEKSL